MDVGRENRRQMILANELILAIHGDVFIFVGRTLQRGAIAGVYFSLDTVSAHGNGISIPALLVSETPIRREPVGDIALSTVERMSTPHDCGRVPRELGVEMIVQPHIYAESRDALAEAAIDLCGRDLSGCDVTAGVRESPSGGRVPHILYGGIIIERKPKNHMMVIRIRATKN